MRIGELSRRSGVSLPTIKYYLREGLLPPGAATGRNQADYGPTHLRRLRLVRVLLDVGRLSISATRAVLTAVDSSDLAVHNLLGCAHQAISPPRTPTAEPTDRPGTGPTAEPTAEPAAGWAAARAEALRLVNRLDWRVDSRAPALDDLADVLTAAATLDVPELLAGFEVYAAAAARVAAHDLTMVAQRAAGTGSAGESSGAERASMVETVVLGTLLGERLLLALRRLAQEDASARRFADPDADPDAGRDAGPSGAKKDSVGA